MARIRLRRRRNVSPSSRARVTLASLNFYPEVTGIAPYSTALARHLAQTFDVRVLAGVPHYPQWQVLDTWPRKSRVEEHVGANLVVTHLKHYVPKAQDAIRRGVYELSWSVRLLPCLLRRRTDVVVTVIPALLCGVIAALVRPVRGYAFGVIVQDVMGAAATQSGIAGGSKVAGIVNRLEAFVLRNADDVVTIHPGLASELQLRYGLSEPPRVIYNWSHVRVPDGTDGASTRERFGWSADETVILHSGNMGLKQDLAGLIQTLSSSPPAPRLRFVLAGNGSEVSRLRQAALHSNIVQIIPGVPDDQFPDLLAAADILLVHERPGVNSMSLPSKLTSYLAAGKPILAVSDPDSATATFLNRTGSGVVVRPGDSAGLTGAIESLRVTPGKAAELGLRGRAFAEAHLSAQRALDYYEAWVANLLVQQAAGKSGRS